MAVICESWLVSPDSFLCSLSEEVLGLGQPHDLSWLPGPPVFDSQEQSLYLWLPPALSYLRETMKNEDKVRKLSWILKKYPDGVHDILKMDS